MLDNSYDDPASTPAISAVLFPEALFGVASKFWQHTGEGISSRMAAFFQQASSEGRLGTRSDIISSQSAEKLATKGPRRYQRGSPKGSRQVDLLAAKKSNTVDKSLPIKDGAGHVQFVEERFGRNLDVSLAAVAKLAIRRRIAGKLKANVDLGGAIPQPENREHDQGERGVSEDDIYLYPTGMSSIYNTHRTLMQARGSLKSIMFGYSRALIEKKAYSNSQRFPYIDTLKILEHFGPGCVFYGHCSSAELDDLQQRCENGEKFLALFCEFPGNPLLKAPDLRRIKELADRFGFAVVVDETIGNFLNVHVLPSADVVVSSLTKVFSGDSNVMGGR